MAEVQYAGEYELQTCEIIASSGVVADISNNIVEINLFENIFSSSLTGSIIFADTNNLTDNLPIIGQEYISIKIITPGMEDSTIDFTENVFCLYEVGNKTPATPKSEIVEIKFCSPELLRNERVRISKSFKETTDQIIKSILENPKYLNTKKKIYLESTAGIRKIVSPNYHPFHLIQNLTRESISKYDDSPHFLFFENLNGFNFRTIQNLYSQGSQGEYHVGDVGFSQNVDQDYKRIINFSIPSRNNSLADIKGGMLGSSLIMHDIYNKKYQKSKFEYFENHDKYMRLESSSIGAPPKYNNILIDEENTIENFTDARIHLHPTSITENDIDSQFIEYSSTQNPYDKFISEVTPAEAVSAEIGGREQQVMNRLITEHNMSPSQAAGIVGNLNRESKLNTGALNPGDGTDGSDSIGIAQWNSTRANNLKSYANSQGKSWKSLNVQTDFIVHELKGSGSYGGGSEKNAWNKLKNSTNASTATDAFASYERFKDYNTPGNIETAERTSEALRVLDDYNVTKGVDPGLLAAAEAKRKTKNQENITNAQTQIAQGDQSYESNKDFLSNRADKWLLHRNQRMHELNIGMTINMSIYGNTSVYAGQVIDISVPIFGTDHEETETSKLQSGLYLISKVRHRFSQPTRTHTISLQATKDSYPIELESKASGKEPKKGGKPEIIPI